MCYYQNEFFCFIARDVKYSRWKMAINRSLGWAVDENVPVDTSMYCEQSKMY